MKSVEVFSADTGLDIYAAYAALKWPGKKVIGFHVPCRPRDYDYGYESCLSVEYRIDNEIYLQFQELAKILFPGEAEKMVDEIDVPEIVFFAGTDDEIYQIQIEFDNFYDGMERVEYWIFEDGKCIHEWT